MALDVDIKSCMRSGETTKGYVKRRTPERLRYREVKHVLKRYLARDIFQQVQQLFP